MNNIITAVGPVPFVVGGAVVLSVMAVLTSLFAVWRTRAMVQASEERWRAANEWVEVAVRNCRESVEALAAQVRDLPPVPAATATATPVNLPGHGLNLSKRSQVLRLHRKGETPEQIAIAMGLPLQEVDLLLKVQRIVLRSL